MTTAWTGLEVLNLFLIQGSPPMLKGIQGDPPCTIKMGIFKNGFTF